MVDRIHDDLDGSDMGIVWMGDVPFLALGAADPRGVVGRWLAKNGPGVQSLAREVPDMWAAQNPLQQAGIGITGMHIEGRHFSWGRATRSASCSSSPTTACSVTPARGIADRRWRRPGPGLAAWAPVTAVVVDLEPVAACCWGTCSAPSPDP